MKTSKTPDLFAEVRRLGLAVQALAAIGAELRLQQRGEPGDPLVRAQLKKVLRAIDPSFLGAVPELQSSPAMGYIELLFRYATDFLERPERSAAWNYTDPKLLQLQGLLSRGNIRSIEKLCSTRPTFEEATREGGAFLDVGTGVAQLAIDAAGTWRGLRIVAIDISEPALALARENVAASHASDRIELRKQNVLDLDDRNAFTIAWLPAPFIPRDDFGRAVSAILEALKPGGWLVVGHYVIPDEPVARELARLQSVRSGGYPWTSDMLVYHLHVHGYTDVEAPTGFPELVIGRRAGL